MEVFVTFLKLGLTSFGGPIAHLGYFRTELVERRRWVSDAQFAQLLAISQFLPGPASSQLGFSLGLMRAGWLGALAAFLAFTLPSALLLVAFAAVLPWFSGEVGQATIQGLKLVACAVVADAVVSMFGKLCPDWPRRVIALLAALVIVVLGAPAVQWLVLVLAAAAGVWFIPGSSLSSGAARLPIHYGPWLAGTLLVVFAVLLLGLPLLATDAPDIGSVAGVFYRAGALVFGGGHVVLPLLEASVVSGGWVETEQFLAGYGAAQAVPGPMFAFSAYLGAILAPDHNPYLMATVALVFIFLPGLLLIAGVLPLWGILSGNSRARGAIAGVNAAVVGLLAAALYDPILTAGINGPVDLAVVLIGFGLLAVGRVSALLVVVWCVLASLLRVWI
jgi:chromate transporter